MDWFYTILQILATLLVVIFIFFLAWYIPHVIARKGTFNAKGRNICIIEKIPVSKDSYIMLLRAFDKYVLVGVTPGGMTTIKELDDDEYSPDDSKADSLSFAQILKTAVSNAAPEGRLRNSLEKVLNRRRGGDDGEK